MRFATEGRVVVKQVVVGLAAAVLLVACSSSREARPITRPTSPSGTSAVTGSDSSESAPTSAQASATSVVGSSPPSSPTTGPGVTSTTTTAPASSSEITGVAVAGATGPALPVGPPYSGADPFSEAVRLNDGTCVGWSGAQGGSTAGLETGARVIVLHAERDQEIGRGRVVGSRWEDMSRGGRQWNCLFDFTATVRGSPAEFRIRVAALEPWLTRPDPTDPNTFVASVSTNADIGLIPSCPPVPEEEPERPPRRTTTTTTAPARLVSGWRAVGQYWSRGVASLCRAGLPVTAIARPCRPPRVGSEYISEVVDSNDSTVSYRDGQRVRLGTQMTVVVATGRLCD